MDASRFDRLTRLLGQRATRRAAIGAALVGLGLDLTSRAAAQDATPPPGATPAATGEKPVFMFVQTFGSGHGEVNPGSGTPIADGTPTPGGGAPFLLTLEGHSGQTIYFSDRPDRIVGAAPTQDFLDGLSFTPENPPNAALVAEFASGQGVIVLELIEPVYDETADTLTYGAEGLQTFAGERLEPVARDQVVERLPAEFGPAALFIDDCPMYTNCYRRIYIGDGVWGRELCGPIPGGPYKECWNLFAWGCVPCRDAWYWGQLVDSCVMAYHGGCEIPG
jgi:hypothetical protein